MKSIVTLLAAVPLALATPAIAQGLGNGVGPQGTGDPLMLIYRIPGIVDDGAGYQAGMATSIHCTSNSLENELIRFKLTNTIGAQVGDALWTVEKGRTIVASTHSTRIFAESIVLSGTAAIPGGHATILATSPYIHCSAMVVDAGATTPSGFALHMVRFNPRPGTLE